MKKHKRFIFTTVVLAVFCLISAYSYANIKIELDDERLYGVNRVLDGDTFTVDVGWREVTVRMLGIDTPETVDPRKEEQCYGREASLYTKDILQGSEVRLDLEENREEKDKYGRYLAYVYLRDGSNLNSSLIEGGYAKEYTFGSPYSMQKEFRDGEFKAKKERKALWGECNIP